MNARKQFIHDTGLLSVLKVRFRGATKATTIPADSKPAVTQSG
jgi:hypothetical protein